MVVAEIALGIAACWFVATRRAGLAAVTAPAVAAGVELPWRGPTQRELAVRLGAGALVGGAAWGALAGWTDGDFASVLSRTAWAVPMVIGPAVGGAR